ncbi:4516_t:CDS:1, partial [Funneliformis geosporum]
MVCEKYNKLLKLCFIFIIIYLFLRVDSFTPVERYVHSSVLIGNKIYFFGGYNGITYTNEVFYLDVSQQFGTSLPPWTDLSLDSGIGFRCGWSTAAALNGTNNNPTIYLIGGINTNQFREDSFTSLVHAFNPNSGKWNVPAIPGTQSVRRRDMQAVTDDTGKIYVFGGLVDRKTGSTTSQYFNDIIILNTNDLTLSYGSIVNSPLKRYLYTATILPNGMIVYIAGWEVPDYDIIGSA